MLGSDLRACFELFDGMVVYRPKPGGDHESDGWLNWSDIEGRFKSSRILFGGKPYDPTDQAQREKLLDAIVGYANTFVLLHLLEKRRLMNPPSLDYRLTAFGRRVGNWGYGDKPGFKKAAVFLLAALGLRLYRYKGLIAVGAAGWAALNAFKFYGAAMSWAGGLPFAAWSAAAVAVVVSIWAVVKSKLG